MYDPSSFENIKVVLEGFIYDQDFDGLITVHQRNDYVNLANLSRRFNMSFFDKEDFEEMLIKGRIQITSSFTQIASEWSSINDEPGSELVITYQITNSLHEIMEKRLIKYFKQAFDQGFDVKWLKTIDSEQHTSYQVQIKLKSLITEDHVDELLEIVKFSISTLKEAYQMIKI